jgi:dihydrodipicolinate synthase/N-acetylneuraminate lyase
MAIVESVLLPKHSMPAEQQRAISDIFHPIFAFLARKESSTPVELLVKLLGLQSFRSNGCRKQ